MKNIMTILAPAAIALCTNGPSFAAEDYWSVSPYRSNSYTLPQTEERAYTFVSHNASQNEEFSQPKVEVISADETISNSMPELDIDVSPLKSTNQFPRKNHGVVFVFTSRDLYKMNRDYEDYMNKKK